MFNFAHSERVTDNEGVTKTYHGVLVPLYGLNDFALNLIFKHVFRKNKALLTDFNGKVLTDGLPQGRETKLKYIASTPEGRYLLSQYRKKDTGIYAASQGLKTYVPDWYINKEGPIENQYTTNCDIYSSYLHKPLLRDEFLDRFSEGVYKPTPLINRVFFGTSNTFARLFGWSSRRRGEGDHGPLVERGELIGDSHLDSDLIEYNLSAAAERMRTRSSKALTERQQEAIEDSKKTSKLKAEYRQQQQQADPESRKAQREQQKRMAAEAKRTAELDKEYEEAKIKADTEHEAAKEAEIQSKAQAKSESEYETDPDDEGIPEEIQAPAGPIVIPDTYAKFENKMIEISALKVPELRKEAASLGINTRGFKGKGVFDTIVKFYIDNAVNLPHAKEVADKYTYTDKRKKKKK